MRLKFENINIVRQADIRMDGLTVIAGENGSGKSTIGKLLFSIVKSLSNISSQKDDYKRKTVSKYVESIYRRLNNLIIRGENTEVNKEFPLPSLKLVDEFMKIFNDDVLDLQAKKALYRTKLASMQRVIDSMADLTPRMRKLLEDDFKNILICLDEPDNNAADMATEVKYLIESEFMNRICSSGTEISRVELEIDDSTGVHFELMKEDVASVNLNPGSLDTLQDATYVESPLYLHLLDAILAARTFREGAEKARLMRSAMVPTHIKDLAEKIDAARLVPEGKEQQLSVDAGGCFKFKDRSLYYEKNGVLFSPINVASGLKSFGIIQMLLETGVINEKKILIWDEPENHLHPKWQIAFASVLVGLAQQGIPVVVSTHSPYFVQGIRYFAAKENVEKFVNYYLVEQNVEDGMSDVIDVTKDLNRVFTKLADPLKDIMNIPNPKVE